MDRECLFCISRWRLQCAAVHASFRLLSLPAHDSVILLAQMTGTLLPILSVWLKSLHPRASPPHIGQSRFQLAEMAALLYRSAQRLRQVSGTRASLSFSFSADSAPVLPLEPSAFNHASVRRIASSLPRLYPPGHSISIPSREPLPSPLCSFASTLSRPETGQACNAPNLRGSYRSGDRGEGKSRNV